MGVSIWEGSKAQALIDAIGQSQNMLNLSDEAKRALLNCFMHVEWANDQGETYYNALQEALYSEGADNHVIYKLKNESFNGTSDYVNTGVLIGSDVESFTILGDVKLNDDVSKTGWRTIFTMGGLYLQYIIPNSSGTRVNYDLNYANTGVVWYHPRVDGGLTNDIRFAISYDKNTKELKAVASRNNEGFTDPQSAYETTVDITTGSNLVIGSNATGLSNFSSMLLNEFSVLDYAYTSEQLNAYAIRSREEYSRDGV